MSGNAGLIGLGIMGSAFAKHLKAAGWTVIGCDTDLEKVHRQEGERFRAAATPAEVAREADVVILSLPSPAAFHAVTVGEGGLAGSGRTGLIVVDTCTLAIEDKQRGSVALAAAGITLLDCPVSGTGAQAVNGDIAILCSGEPDAIETARPVLEAFSRAVHVIGPFGQGSIMKYVANLLVAIHNVSAAEAMVFGMKAGIAPETLYGVLTDGAGTSRMLEMRGPMMVANDYDSAVSATQITQEKDMGIIGAFAKSIGCPTPLFSATEEIYRTALQDGFAASDTASVCAVLEARAGFTRGGT
jgi:3-hydroxyisobutyrate dehydrogenase-like beta-hydroxyacid dehydrogenase